MEGWSVLSGDLLHFFAHGVPGMSAAHRDCIALPVWSFLHRLPPGRRSEQLFQEVAQRCGTCYYPLELKAILSLLDFFRGRFGDFSILSLQKMLLPYAYFLPMGTYRHYSERQLQVRMMDSFSDLFPTYRLLGQEYLLPRRGPGRSSGHGGDRAVLFELKLGDADPRHSWALRPDVSGPHSDRRHGKSSAWRALPPAMSPITPITASTILCWDLRERQFRMPGGDLAQLRELVLSCYSLLML